MFQQDNASIRTANITWELFLNNQVHAFLWPSVSPDLNPMENVWSLLVRAVYANGKQYASVLKLKAIIYHWNEINKNRLKSFVRSMPDRVFTLISKSDAYTGYQHVFLVSVHIIMQHLKKVKMKLALHKNVCFNYIL